MTEPDDRTEFAAPEAPPEIVSDLMKPRPPSQQVQQWHAEMAQTGRVVLQTSQTKASLILIGSLVFAAIGVAGLILEREVGLLVVLGFTAAFGLAGAGAAAHRLARPEVLIVEPQGLRWGLIAVPWAWVSTVERFGHHPGTSGFIHLRLNDAATPFLAQRSTTPGRAVAATERALYGGPSVALPMNLNGRTGDQLRFLREVHARSQGWMRGSR